MTRVKLLWMPGMQCVVYTLEYENISLNLCCNQSSLLLTSLTNKTLDGSDSFVSLNDVIVKHSNVHDYFTFQQRNGLCKMFKQFVSLAN